MADIRWPSCSRLLAWTVTPRARSSTSAFLEINEKSFKRIKVSDDNLNLKSSKHSVTWGCTDPTCTVYWSIQCEFESQSRLIVPRQLTMIGALLARRSVGVCSDVGGSRGVITGVCPQAHFITSYLLVFTSVSTRAFMDL